MSFDAENFLNSLEPIGWKLGLERMELLSDELGRPQDRFETIHVVGTNGKSSVTQMTAGLLAAHGRRVGCSVSPHLHRWSERVLVDGHQIDEDSFDAAVQTTAAAAERVNAGLGDEDRVTQFELATAASFLALADAGVDAAVIEAGLGGRLDATNSIQSKVTVLTSIGLDHTEWLGETELEIAGEKLAVLRPGSVLVLGRVSDEVGELARRVAREKDAELIQVAMNGPGARSGKASSTPGPGKCESGLRPMASRGAYQRRNFAISEAAARAFLGDLDDGKVEAVAASIVVPGRLEEVAAGPPVFVDVAHNRPGAAALAESLPEISEGRMVIACLGILADKDGPGMLAELGHAVGYLVLTELPEAVLAGRARPGAKSFAAAELQAGAGSLGIESEVVSDPLDALARAKKLALDRNGIVLVAGSHYLVTAMGI